MERDETKKKRIKRRRCGGQEEKVAMTTGGGCFRRDRQGDEDTGIQKMRGGETKKMRT